jgi:hypothetical protein
VTITLDEPLVREVVDTGIDMGWVTFSDEDPEPSCKRVHPECGNVATHKVWYQPDDTIPDRECACGTHVSELCTKCFEVLSSRSGLVLCARCHDTTGDDFFKKIVYSERLR